MKCLLCLKDIVRYSPNQKYCSNCKKDKKREWANKYARRVRATYPKRERSYSKKIYHINCESCQTEFQASYKNRRFCEDCRYKKQVHTNNVKNVKRYEARLELLELSNFTCAICEEQKDPGLLVIDHDHSCCPPARACVNCIRGVLCSLCNSGLGSFKDDPKNLQKAFLYLQKNKKVEVDFAVELLEVN